MINNLILLMFLFFVPGLLGLPWYSNSPVTTRLSKYVYCYVMGYFVMLAIFEIIIVPAALLNLTFETAAILYSLALLVSAVVILRYAKSKSLRQALIEKTSCHLRKAEWFYAGIFFVLLFIQIYYALFYSRTYMADDGYVVFSTSALATNYINLTDSYTGLYQTHNYVWLYRVIQSSNYFPAYLSWLSRVHPTIIAHTVIYVVVLILAYGTYFVMANQLFDHNDNRFMFLCLVSTLFIFGYHSHYSLTFRLLGPNNEGKAILAVVLAPFMMVIMQEILKTGYRTRYGIQLMILSIAACSLTMGGIYTMIALLFAIVLFATCKGKTLQPLLYLLWGGCIPGFFASLYLISRFAVI